MLHNEIQTKKLEKHEVQSIISKLTVMLHILRNSYMD